MQNGANLAFSKLCAICLHQVGEHVSSACTQHSSKVYNPKEERHKADTAEAHDTVDDVTVRQLYFHVLPRPSYVIRGQPKQST